MRHDHPVATVTDFSFVDTLLGYGEDYTPQPGDVIEVAYSDLTPTGGARVPTGRATVVSVGKKSVVLESKRGKTFEVARSGFFHVAESPAIREELAKVHEKAVPDGVAFSDSCVPAALRTRLRKRVSQLAAQEPVDHHPGSGTRVRDLVHPSLYPYVEGVSRPIAPLPKRVQKAAAPAKKLSASEKKLRAMLAPTPSPPVDRFGRPFESSRYQWLPTPFRIAKNGSATIDGYINNLDPERYAPLYTDLAALFTSVLPMVESVVDYVDRTRFWQNGEEAPLMEADLPGMRSRKKKVAKGPKPKRRSLRGRELQVIPKIVEYRLGQGESHEGVWHVEGMSHEHIVATCVFVLDRSESLHGGDLSFKRPYTLEEAGRLFWNISQSRPHVIEKLVDEGTIPVGSVATPAGRVVVFPNSHIHKLEALTVAAGASEATRQVIVFWIVDPDVRIPSTREVAPQQGVMSHDEALKIRLALMEERRLHKASFNPRAVSLCEH